MHLVFQELLYDPAFFEVIPLLIKGMEEHDDEIFKNLALGMHQSADIISPAMGITVLKYDNGLILNDSGTEPGDPLHNSLNYYDNILDMVRSIDNNIQDTLETFRVESEIPCLIITGSLDPMTLSFHAKILKRSLSNSYLLEFPGQGHGLTRSSECAINIGVDFFNNPDLIPDTTCIESINVTPGNWAGTIYHNPHIGTLVWQTAMESNWFPAGGIILLLIGFLFILINAFTNLCKKKVKSLSHQLRIRNTITKSSILLSILFIAGLGLLIGRTMTFHGPIILVGLVKGASYFLYLSFVVLTGTLFSGVFYIRSIKHSSAYGKIFYGFLCI